MNKSLVTNLLAIAVAIVGFLMPATHPLAAPLLAIGLFATSGAFTNWLAVHMLFEKVPGLYGSGVVPTRFKEFKGGIRDLIMSQFFTSENVAKFFASEGDGEQPLDPEPILELIDYDGMFQNLTETVMASPMGGMLGMLGGAKALAPLKEPFEKNVEKEIRHLVGSPKLKKALVSGVKAGKPTEAIIAKVDGIVNRRLEELTPQMVKEIVQDMIREHLGWLVVWGGVFGGLIGLLTSFLP